jgi:AcrR family transcriptional regulator
MARWEPGARERLAQAALELFARQGFEQTAAEEIAQSVGLTERTFFRHFADKREVLFYGQDRFVSLFLDALAAARADATTLELIGVAVRAGTTMFNDERRSYSRLRQRIIDANPSLQERERHKLAGLAQAVAGMLRERGIDALAATLAAESAATVFAVAFAQWIQEGETRSFDEIADHVLAELVSVTATGVSR